MERLNLKFVGRDLDDTEKQKKLREKIERLISGLRPGKTRLEVSGPNPFYHIIPVENEVCYHFNTGVNQVAKQLSENKVVIQDHLGNSFYFYSSPRE